MKKLAVLTMILIVFYCLMPERASAEEKDVNEIISELIDALDGDEMNELLNGVWESAGKGKTSFKEKILSVINGDFKADYNSVISAVASMIFEGIRSLVPVLLTVSIIALFYSVIKSLNPDLLSEETDRILYFTCYAAILGLLIYKAFDVAQSCLSAIEVYVSEMQIALPLILTVMAVTGNSSSASVFRPAVAFLGSGISGVITSFVFPLIFFLILLSAVSGLSQSIKTGKFAGFISSLIKWILGICTTVFTVFLSVQGLSAGAFDGVMLRVTKYAVGNSVPLVGGFLKDGAEIFVASGVLIKNAIGVCGLALVIGSFVPPLAELVAFSLFLKLVAGVIEPFADSRISDYVFSLAKNLNYILASVLVVCFMYVLTIVIVITSGGSLL